MKFKVDPDDAKDQYATLFADDVVLAVDSLTLPRYGLGNYETPSPHKPPTPDEAKVLADLSRAGNRLKGFCRTNLFKRLESSGHAFILSLERHVLRNFIFLRAIENNLPLPIGTQDMGLLDPSANDQDSDLWNPADGDDDDSPLPPGEGGHHVPMVGVRAAVLTESDFQQRAGEIYRHYSSQFRSRFKWLRAALRTVARQGTSPRCPVMNVLARAGAWDPKRDAKLLALVELLQKQHPTEKVLVFSQFADTVDYLDDQLKIARIPAAADVTGDTEDPTAIAHRFSPGSNDKRDVIPAANELRVVVATNVFSEGQNLQDCAIIVNFDLPWAIIRLIQRAGRVDRIGQNSDTILCYSFLPADGVDRIINLRNRVRQRLRENAQVVGTDEAFFDDDDKTDLPLFDLYHEKSGILDGDDDTEVDLASRAYQIWKNAVDEAPELEKIIPAMPNVVFSARRRRPGRSPEGALVYLRTAKGNDALAWVNTEGKSVTESQFAILKAADCSPGEPAVPRDDRHHEMVAQGVKLIVETEKSVGGQLGRPRGPASAPTNG